MREFLYCHECGQRFDAAEIPEAERKTAGLIPICKTCRPSVATPRGATPVVAVPVDPPAQKKTSSGMPAAQPSAGTKSNPRLPTAQAPSRPKSTGRIPTVAPPPGKKSTARIPAVRGTAMPPTGRTKSSPRNVAVRGTGRVPTRAARRSAMPALAAGIGILVVIIVVIILASGNGEKPQPRVAARPPRTLPPAPPAAKVAPAPKPVPAPAPKTEPKPQPAPKPAPVPKPKTGMKNRGEAAALDAIEKARAFASANPDDIKGQVAAWEDAVRLSALTPHFDIARKARAAVLARGRSDLPKKMTVIDDLAKPSRDQEYLQQAIDVYEKARGQIAHPDWQIMITKKVQEIRSSAQTLFASVKTKADEARRKGDENEVRRLTERVQRWGFPHLSDGLQKHLAGVPRGRRPAAPKTPKPAKPPAPKKPAVVKKPKPAAPPPPSPAPTKKKPGSATEISGLVDNLKGQGTFRKMDREGAGPCWSNATDYGKGPENHVAFSFEAQEGNTYRCWIYAGACCEETFRAFYQATGAEGPHPNNRNNTIKAEPGSASLLLLEVKLRRMKKEHVDHGGPKKPSTWLWIPVPLAKEIAAGANEIRIISGEKGFSVAGIFVSATAEAPPSFADFKKTP